MAMSTWWNVGAHFACKLKRVWGWSVHLESPNLVEGEFEHMRILFSWVNGKVQDVVSVLSRCVSMI